MHRRLLTLLATLGAAAGLSPAAASAGSYEVLSCGAAGGVNRSWTVERTSPAMKVSERCAGGADDGDFFSSFTPAMAVRTELGQPYAPLGTAAYWRIDAPAPLTLTGYNFSVHMHSESDSWRLVAESSNGEAGHCQSNEPGTGIVDFCEIGEKGGGGMSASPRPLAAASWFRIGTRCVLNPCDMGSSVHAAAAAVFSAAMTVNDPVAPSATVSGVAPSVLEGAQVTASVSGSDQTGIQRLELLVDGAVVATSNRGCDFTRVLPCEAPGGSVSAQLMSQPLAAGTHTVVARAVDAGGNVASSAPATVVASAPGPGPGGGPETPGGGGTTPQPPAPEPTTPNTPPGGGGTTPPGPAVRASARLKVAKVSRSGSRVRVRGSVAAGCRSRLHVTVTAAGRSRTAKLKVGRTGKWGVTISGVHRTGTVRVKARALSSATCRSATRSSRL